MKMKNMNNIVKQALAGTSETYLQEIVDHGIHNITNDFQGENDEEYDAFTEEFDRQARELLIMGRCKKWKC